MGLMSTAHLSGKLQRSRGQRSERHSTLSLWTKLVTHAPHLIDGEANGVHVLPLFTELPAVLLDQADHKTASILSVIGVIVLLVQLDHKLRVRPEGVCKETFSTYRRTSITSQAQLGRSLRRTARNSSGKTITLYKVGLPTLGPHGSELSNLLTQKHHLQGLFLQPPAVEPLLQVPSNLETLQCLTESSSIVSGVSVHSSTRE